MLKKFLNNFRVKKDSDRVVKACASPLIELKISLIDGATVQTNGEAIKLLVDALGEEKATKWHADYVNQINELAKKAIEDLEQLVKDEKSSRDVIS